ncbi:hypothetical protein U3516DRAFT_768578 [Neocallimastix sp. 'constans']
MPDINLVNYKNSCSVVDITEFIEFFLSTLMKTRLKGCNVLCQINEKCESCPCSLALMTKIEQLVSLLESKRLYKSNNNLESIRNTSNTEFSTILMKNINNKLKALWKN